VETSIKQERDWFNVMEHLGHEPLSLRKWEYEFYDPDVGKLRPFCKTLSLSGLTFCGLKEDRGSIGFEPGWVVTVFEVCQHTPETMCLRTNDLHRLAEMHGMDLLCGKQGKPAPRRKVATHWEQLWDAKLAKANASTGAAESLVAPEAKALFTGTSTHSLTGGQPDWVRFTTVLLKGTTFVLTDMCPGPVDGGLAVDLSPGEHVFFVKAHVRGIDRRCSHLRAVRCGATPLATRQIGTVSTDLATLGIYDPKGFTALRKQGGEAFYEWGESQLPSDRPKCGILVHNIRRSAVLLYVGSGFGDGTCPVYELTDGSERVGFEVEFINEVSVAP
jgi:hypothetical protein